MNEQEDINSNESKRVELQKEQDTKLLGKWRQ